MTATPRQFDLLSSPSAICAGYATYEWSASQVGHPDGWTPFLRSAISAILDSRFPMFIAWGPQLALLYNGAMIDLLDHQHPAALGTPIHQVWPDLWSEQRPLIDAALAGEPSYGVDIMRPIVRNGCSTTHYFTLAHSPLRDVDGDIAGVLCVFHETSDRVHLEKRQALQLQLVDRLSRLNEPHAIARAANEMLGHFLDAAWVCQARITDDNAHFEVNAEWAANGRNHVTMTHGTLDDFGPDLVDQLRRGETTCVNDVTTDPRSAPYVSFYLRLGIRTLLAQPIIHDGRLHSVLAVYGTTPRHWTIDEHTLAADVAERCAGAVERARTERALHSASMRQTSLLATIEFQLTVADALRKLDSTSEIFQRTSTLLGRFLNVSRVFYGDYDSTRGLVNFHSNYANGISALNGSRPASHFGIDNFASLQAGELWQSSDVSVDPRTCGPQHWPNFAAAGVRATVVVPLHHDGATTACLFVSHHLPRHWSADELRVIKDVAERAWSAIERVRAEAALRSADQRKDEFLAMLAHELRNPLAPIAAAAELLHMGPLDADRVLRTSGIIKRQVAHMTDLIDDLLDVSRVTRGLATLASEQVDLQRVVADALEQVRPLIEARHHQVDVQIEASPAMMQGDHKRLVQVVANLLNNAAKYTPDGGRIQLSMASDQQHAVLRVQDNGIGISPELLPTVFELFSQAERTPDRAQGGLGLGLALAKSLVELHGGSISAASMGREQGSTFSLRLPRLPCSGASTPRAPGSESTSMRALDVLLVDDNIDAAQTMAMLLESIGHRVALAHDPQVALRRAASQRFDACLLDIGLPGMDGHQLARRLREMPTAQRALLVAITGYGAQERHADSAFDHVFVKPADPAQLLKVLAALPASA